jgi:hypothetical protein
MFLIQVINKLSDTSHPGLNYRHSGQSWNQLMNPPQGYLFSQSQQPGKRSLVHPAKSTHASHDSIIRTSLWTLYSSHRFGLYCRRLIASLILLHCC